MLLCNYIIKYKDMKTKAILKSFGTGQITIPKQWRDRFNTDEYKAFIDEKSGEMRILPVKRVEIEETKWLSASELKKDLKDVDLDDRLKTELLEGYKNSDFYKSQKKVDVQN